MENLTLSSRTVTALRAVRIGAWVAVALCLGVNLVAPSPAQEPDSAQSASHLTGASTCGCLTKQGTIS